MKRSCVPRLWLIAAVLLTMPLAGVRAAPPTVQLEDLTWTELRDAMASGTTTVIIPIGGTEQSGPYMALGKHNARVKYLSDRIAQGSGNAVVAPVVAYVPEGGLNPLTSHMRFPGTITVSDEVFEKTLISAANGFKAHGFRNVVFLGDHGGYQKNLQRIAAQLGIAWAGSGARALAPAEYYEASAQGFAKILRGQGFRDDEIGTHAALADTALQLAVAPAMVRDAQLRVAAAPHASDGIYGGDPRRATAELGQSGVDAIVSATVRALRSALASGAGSGVRSDVRSDARSDERSGARSGPGSASAGASARASATVRP